MTNPSHTPRTTPDDSHEKMVVITGTGRMTKYNSPKAKGPKPVAATAFPTQPTKMKKAFAYLRVSGKSQLAGDGFPRQLQAIRQYATTHGYTLKAIFQEEGVSGSKDLENRPALQDLLAALYSNGVHTVIIEKLDRLARDLMVQETILADLTKKGITVISVTEPDLHSDDPSRKLMRQIFGAIAEYDKAMTVIKLRAARQRQRAILGHYSRSHAPGGYKPRQRV